MSRSGNPTPTISLEPPPELKSGSSISSSPPISPISRRLSLSKRVKPISVSATPISQCHNAHQSARLYIGSLPDPESFISRRKTSLSLARSSSRQSSKEASVSSDSTPPRRRTSILKMFKNNIYTHGDPHIPGFLTQDQQSLNHQLSSESSSTFMDENREDKKESGKLENDSIEKPNDWSNTSTTGPSTPTR